MAGPVTIPKPGIDKFRPISLPSCFSKVLAHSCSFIHLQSHGALHPFPPPSVVAFLVLKSAFDVVNREIILDLLLDFGVKGNLLR